MKTLLRNVKIFDGEKVLAERGSLLFDENKIDAVAQALPEDQTAEADRVIDGTGMTVTPGLIDSHVHLGLAEDAVESMALAAGQARDLWRYGITTVRSCVTGSMADIRLRDLIAAGAAKGVRIVASGRGISITGGHAWKDNFECDTIEETVKAARTIIRSGADQVKLFATGGMATKGSIPHQPQLTEAQLRAAVAEAEAAGKLTSAHATGIEGARNAIRAGVRTIEHVPMDEATAELMKKNGCYYCPTIVTRYRILHSTLPEYAYMKKKADPSDLVRKERALKLCREYGIPVCAGTDAGTGALVPLGESFREELDIYREYGMSPEEVLTAATKNGAKMMRIDGITGGIREGLAADLAVFDGDPTREISEVGKLCMTFQGGRLVYINPELVCRRTEGRTEETI